MSFEFSKQQMQAIVIEEAYCESRDWLIRHGGRRMERALIRAGQRYEVQKPVRVRALGLRRSYGQKRGRAW